MTSLRGLAFIATLASFGAPTAATGQSVSLESLVRRVDSLQRRTVDLERRVAELEAAAKSYQGDVQATAEPGKAGDLTNWRRLKRGMKPAEVRTLLGEPERVDAGYVTTWFYLDFSNVKFISDKVDGWTEPLQ